ncbi:hypothetical protein HII31_00907 [Pseudocercospora fuligena]|uniref:F-box domain-containing protein n=1 Tax=Pseudocercospora fuligena TaxID=685502 RepID=A0A8H6VMH7_9PEZI|nr:hypothetical protein HII31_00907 [Pseudocercospora fuligena]
MSSNTTFPKFEVDIKDLWTTRGEEAYVAYFEQWYKRLEAKSAAREIAAKSKAFRFMDLPAELRNRIYAFTFQNEKNFGEQRSLALLATPAITRVSKQIRQETLPLFFATTSFRLDVCSYFTPNHDVRLRWPYTSAAQISNSGTLHIKQEVKKAIRYAGDKALIRNIEFYVCHARDWRASDRMRGINPSFVVFTAKIKVERGNLMVDVGLSSDLRDRSGVSDSITAVMGDMKATIEKASNKEDFEGFSLRDLEQIVKTLRT